MQRSRKSERVLNVERNSCVHYFSASKKSFTISFPFSGTFIALDQLLRIFDNPSKGEIDIFNVVYQLRKDRRHLVQTLAQYTFLYRCLYEYANKK